MAKGNKNNARILPTINPVTTNEPPELNKHLNATRSALTAAITGKRNFDKGFAFTVAGLWQLTVQDGHFDHSELKDFVAKLHNGSTESSATVIETVCNKLGLYKAMPEIIEPEKKTKKSFGSDAQGWREYQDKMNAWKRSYNPLKTMLTRSIIVVAYLTAPERKGLVNVIKSSSNKNTLGCLYINGSMYEADQQRNREIVPYDKACSDLEERARKQFTLKRRQAASSDGDTVSINRAFEVMRTAIKTDSSNVRTQPLLINAMKHVQQGIELMQVSWPSTVSGYREAVRNLLYTLMNEQQGIIAKEVSDAAMQQMDKWEPPKDESKQMNVTDVVADSGKVKTSEEITA